MNPVQINGVELMLTDEDPVYKNLIPEIESSYAFDEITFRSGDVVLDIGAHVGVVSMYLAKLNPEIIIHAYEPWPDNHKRLRANLRANKVSNVTAHKLAVTADGRNLEMVAGTHTAEPSAFFTANSQPRVKVRSTTIPRILDRYGIRRVALLKLDCEGAEHEILEHSEDWLDRIQHMRGEIHMVGPLRDKYTIEGTRERWPDAHWMIVEGA